MRVVAALGGNALLQRGQPLDAAVQRLNVKTAVASLAALARDHQIVVTHGNGPQVGLLALQGEAFEGVTPYPLDVLGAETEGMIGYLLDQELANELPDREVAALLTQTVVSATDPAFARPTKPVGPMCTEDQARQLAAARGWTVARDGAGWRRVVPSPEPLEIVELRTIRLLMDAGVLVVCAGGGGIPVVEHADRTRHGVEAVVDKDLSAAVLAAGLDADALILLTDVHAAWTDWGTEYAKPLRRATPDQLDALTFAEGSMGPKIDAAKRFVRATGGRAAIGALEDAPALVTGTTGTLVTAEPAALQWWAPGTLKGVT